MLLRLGIAQHAGNLFVLKIFVVKLIGKNLEFRECAKVVRMWFFPKINFRLTQFQNWCILRMFPPREKEDKTTKLLRVEHAVVGNEALLVRSEGNKAARG